MRSLSRLAWGVREVAQRTWLAFCGAAILSGTAMCLVDGDHPLRSDDPYLVGMLFGGLAAFLAAVSAIAEIWLGEGRRNHIALLIVCALWCCCWTATEFFAIEGQGLGFDHDCGCSSCGSHLAVSPMAPSAPRLDPAFDFRGAFSSVVSIRRNMRTSVTQLFPGGGLRLARAARKKKGPGSFRLLGP